MYTQSFAFRFLTFVIKQSPVCLIVLGFMLYKKNFIHGDNVDFLLLTKIGWYPKNIGAGSWCLQ
jgi:hypothetical protein